MSIRQRFLQRLSVSTQVWQRRMAPFPSDTIGARQQTSVDNDAAADTSTENYPKHDARSGAGTIGRFGECKTIGVIGNSNARTELFDQVAPQCTAVPPRRIAIRHRT